MPTQVAIVPMDVTNVAKEAATGLKEGKRCRALESSHYTLSTYWTLGRCQCTVSSSYGTLMDSGVDTLSGEESLNNSPVFEIHFLRY